MGCWNRIFTEESLDSLYLLGRTYVSALTRPGQSRRTALPIGMHGHETEQNFSACDSAGLAGRLRRADSVATDINARPTYGHPRANRHASSTDRHLHANGHAVSAVVYEGAVFCLSKRGAKRTTGNRFSGRECCRQKRSFAS